jgi:hypothetical protein
MGNTQQTSRTSSNNYLATIPNQKIAQIFGLAAVSSSVGVYTSRFQHEAWVQRLLVLCLVGLRRLLEQLGAFLDLGVQQLR